LSTFKFAAISAFNLPEASIDNIAVRYQGRILTCDSLTLPENKVKLGDQLELVMMGQSGTPFAELRIRDQQQH
jgi:hypothetical protein